MPNDNVVGNWGVDYKVPYANSFGMRSVAKRCLKSNVASDVDLLAGEPRQRASEGLQLLGIQTHSIESVVVEDVSGAPWVYLKICSVTTMGSSSEAARNCV
jgi:hypothetical protein